MKTLRRYVAAFAFLALGIFGAPAQTTTNVVDGYSTNFPSLNLGGSGNGWIIKNGGSVSNAGAQLGVGGGDSSNFVLVTAGGVWTNAAGNLYVGSSVNTPWNSIQFTGGGTGYLAGANFVLGNNPGSSSNLVLVAGSGSVLTMGSARLGDAGAGNMTVVTNGGYLNATGNLTIGNDPTGSFQQMLVSGAGSIVRNGGTTLTVGGGSRSSSLTISSGGIVSNSGAILGTSISASNASVLVNGSGSRWIGTGSIKVGAGASMASVLVTNGGYAKPNDLFIGASPTGNLNRVTVTDSGSLLDVVSALRVGGSDAANPGGSSNSLFIVNGGTVSNANTTLGLTAASSNNQAVVAGAGSTWQMSGSLYVGDGGYGSSLVVTNGGVVRALNNVVAGNAAGANGNQILVSGAGSVLEAAGAQITIGVSGSGSSLQVLGGGVVSNGGVVNAVGSSSMSNLGVVAGIGSRWVLTNNGALYVGQGAGSGFNRLYVTNGGLVNGLLVVGAGGVGSNQVTISSGGIVSNSAGNASLGGVATHNNMVTISDTGSEWYVGGLIYLGRGNNNLLLVTNGGRLRTANIIYIPDTSGTNNVLRVSGAGSYVSAGGGINFREGQFNRVEVLNGATMDNPGSLLFGGSGALYSNNTFLASGDGTFVRIPQIVLPGSSNNAFIVTDGATVEINTLRMSMNGIISNSGGVFQFTAGNPVLTITSGAAMYLNNGTISWRARDDATPTITGNQFTNVQFSGNNSFQLNSASNAAGLASYLVDSGSPSTTYQRLVLAGTNAAFRAGVLTIGSGGELYTSNSIGATIAALVTNSGTVRVYDSVLTYQSNVVVNGGSFVTRNGTNQFNRGLSLAGNSTLTFTNGSSRITGVISNTAGSTIQALNTRVTFQDAVVVGGLYYSDPSTNTFVTNVTVTASGALYGSNGDLFVFQRDLTLASTNRTQFNLANAEVRFDSGAGTSNHTLNLSGSGALDKGSNWIAIADLATNFAFGTLTIASGNHLVVQGDAGTNALYVGWLNLQGIQTNSYAQVTNGIFSALGLPNINLYYDKHVAGNDYLLGQTYSLWGGSLLIPIPEPTSLMAMGGGLALLVLLRRRTA